MAGENIGDVFVTLGVDASDFDREIKAAIRDAMREVERAVARSMGDVTSDVEKFERAVKDSLQDVTRAFERGFMEGANEALDEVRDLRRGVNRQMDQIRDDVGQDLPAPNVGAATTAVGGFGKSLGGAVKSLGLLRTAIAGFAGFAVIAGVAKGAAVAVRAIATASEFAAKRIAAAVQETTALNESINAVRVLLLDGADSFFEFSSDSADALGIIRSDLNSAIVPFASLLRQAGGGGEELSGQMQVLSVRAADVASVFNEDVNEVLRTFGAALRGETEPARRFGVNLSEFAIKAKAVELGMARVGDRLTSGQRAMGAYASILEQTNFAQGDFQRTAKVLPNALRRLRSTVTETSISLGQEFVPALTQITNAAIPAVDGLRDELAKAGDIIADELFGPDVLAAVDSVIQAAGDVAVAFARFISPIIKRAIPAVKELAETISGFVDRNAEEIAFLGEFTGAVFSTVLELVEGLITSIEFAIFRAKEFLGINLFQGLFGNETARDIGRIDSELADVANTLSSVTFEGEFTTKQIFSLADAFGVDLSQGIEVAESSFLQLLGAATRDDLDLFADVLGISVKELIPLLERAGIEFGTLTPEVQDLADAYNLQARSLQDVFNSQLALVDQNFALIKTEKELAAAVKTLNTLERKGTATAEELAEAQTAVVELTAKRNAVGAELAETLTKEGTTFDELRDSVLRTADSFGANSEALSGLTTFIDGTVDQSINSLLDLMNEGAKIAGVEFSEFVGGIEEDLAALADEVAVRGPTVHTALVEAFGAPRAELVAEFKRTGNEAGLALVEAIEEKIGQARLSLGGQAVSRGQFEFGIPAFAQGGIVTRPTLALVGEAGPEAIIPLSGNRGAGGGITVNVAAGAIAIGGSATVEDGQRVMRGMLDEVMNRRRAELAVQGLN